MKLFSYEIEGETSFAVCFGCEECARPILIDTAHLRAGQQYQCSICGSGLRMPAERVDEVSKQLFFLAHELKKELSAAQYNT